MKKFKLACLLLCLTTMLFVISCGDDDNGSTGPSINPEDFDFYFAVTSFDYDARDGQYIIIVDSYSGETVEGVSVLVDNQNVIMSNMWNTWTGTVTLDDSGNHDFVVVIGDDSYEFNLDIASFPEVNWPDTYDAAEAMNLAWTLNPDQDSDYQWLYAYADDYSGNEDGKDVNLDASARSYAVPANWFDGNFISYYFDITENNIKSVGDLIAFSTEISSADYGFYKKSVDKKAVIKRIAKQLNK